MEAARRDSDDGASLSGAERDTKRDRLPRLMSAQEALQSAPWAATGQVEPPDSADAIGLAAEGGVTDPRSAS